MHASDFLEQKLGDHLFLAVAYALPTQLHIHLYTAATAEDGTGLTEVSGGSYAAVQKDPGGTHWERATGQDNGMTVYRNKTVVTFPAPTADWGTVTHYGLKDESGNLLVIAPLTAPKTVNNGDPAPEFAAASLQFLIG